MDKPKILHFPEDFSLEEINKVLKNRSDILYYTRYIKENNQFHLVKHNNTAFFSMQVFESQLLNFYDSKSELKKIVNGAKIKGNDNFAIIENISNDLMEKLKNDFTKLLTK
jgi:hypothetical protein